MEELGLVLSAPGQIPEILKAPGSRGEGHNEAQLALLSRGAMLGIIH